jgi:maltose/moltooligosaccharide transporter
MKKPKLSFWQIWNMSFGFLGIQFGFGLQNGNVSRIFQTLGADIDRIPILWIAAPVTGLIIQPIIGHLSDNTWNRLGRRRPYFMIGAVMASLALILMPNSPSLWVAAGMLWIMDASINISMEPFRAFVGDMLPENQRTFGFTMQSFFIGIGAFIASWMPYVMDKWLHFSNEAPAGVIPETVKYSFYFGGAVFLIAVLWTVFSTKEYSPEQMAAFEKNKSEAKQQNQEKADAVEKYYLRGAIWTLASVILAIPIYYFKLEKELYTYLIFGLLAFGMLQFLSGLLVKNKKESSGLVSIITDLYRMPLTMKQLAIVQFFSWFALFSMWIYTTSAVTSHILHTSDTRSIIYNEGANLVSGMFGWYNLFAAGFGLAILPSACQDFQQKNHPYDSTFCGRSQVWLPYFS